MMERQRGGVRAFLFSRSGVVLLGFLAVAGYFLWEEHAAHLLGYLPLILILGLCLGMHAFMHGGHGGHGGGNHGSHRDGSGSREGEK
jgi:uncharacterized membrane protein